MLVNGRIYKPKTEDLIITRVFCSYLGSRRLLEVFFRYSPGPDK